ncbi:hypothetical protein [Pleionea mediterranea]|uniref:Lipoprotein n=1 Tax=Pleionea mediterranea TaxID=523701 RepID=A0A316F8L8_9GAMM|nr:hypothetical protein [Pleionea mediterranea]PWK43589.1 hypothetical protein C8D97_1163 [Pleionea mediterranea]
MKNTVIVILMLFTIGCTTNNDENMTSKDSEKKTPKVSKVESKTSQPIKHNEGNVEKSEETYEVPNQFPLEEKGTFCKGKDKVIENKDDKTQGGKAKDHSSSEKCENKSE